MKELLILRKVEVNVALVKNTIRLYATFTTFSDLFSDPTEITLTIREVNDKTLISSYSYSASTITRESEGVYYATLTMPEGIGSLEYEWTGTLEDYPIVNRGTIAREWMRV